MTDFKAGDKIRYIDPDDNDIDARRVINYIGERFVVYTATHRDGTKSEHNTTLTCLKHDFEPVPEVFEKGKRYAPISPRDSRPDFTVLYADDEVAFGKYHGPANTYTYVTHGSRHKYLEV